MFKIYIYKFLHFPVLDLIFYTICYIFQNGTFLFHQLYIHCNLRLTCVILSVTHARFGNVQQDIEGVGQKVLSIIYHPLVSHHIPSIFSFRFNFSNFLLSNTQPLLSHLPLTSLSPSIHFSPIYRPPPPSLPPSTPLSTISLLSCLPPHIAATCF